MRHGPPDRPPCPVDSSPGREKIFSVHTLPELQSALARARDGDTIRLENDFIIRTVLRSEEAR